VFLQVVIAILCLAITLNFAHFILSRVPHVMLSNANEPYLTLSLILLTTRPPRYIASILVVCLIGFTWSLSGKTSTEFVFPWVYSIRHLSWTATGMVPIYAGMLCGDVID
jgi:hypothetical protein